MNRAPGDSPANPGSGADGRGSALDLPRRSALPATRLPAARPAAARRAGASDPALLPAVAAPRSTALPATRTRQSAVPVESVRPRSGEIVADGYLVTVGAADGSEARPCPPERIPAAQLLSRTASAALGDGSKPSPGHGPSGAVLLEREDEVKRLRQLLAQGRSIRVTGPSGSGRTALLGAVADSCADLLPGGVVRLSGHRRAPADLVQDLFAATHRAPGYRPDPSRLRGLLGRVAAIVVIDDVDFGGAALAELLDLAPECTFLISATPEAAAPVPGSRLEESRLSGLTRQGSMNLLTRLAGRPLHETERAWAIDLWFESEGLPLRFVQAGALLRHRDVAADVLAAAEEDREALFGAVQIRTTDPDDDPALHEEALRQALPLPSVAESAAPAVRIAPGLSAPAQAVLRLAVSLGGECPTASHLPALADATRGEDALRELVECGLAAAVGPRHRLTAGVCPLLAAEWGSGVADGTVQHFAWWVGHASVTPEQVAAEADVLMAVMVAQREAGAHSAVLQLARAAAPSLALALRWGAWDQVLRLGLEAARRAGAVADEAWFRHELGVLALCLGAEDRARAEFEASIALRGALGERGGAAAHRMLALISAGGNVGATAPQGRQLPGRAMGQLPWRRSASVGPAGLPNKRKAVLAGAGVLLVGALGAILGLGAAGNGATTPAPVGSTDPVPAGGYQMTGIPGADPSDSGGATASPSSPTGSGASRPPTRTSGTQPSGSTGSAPTAARSTPAAGTTRKPAPSGTGGATNTSMPSASPTPPTGQPSPSTPTTAPSDSTSPSAPASSSAP
jgi:hypothetical protein